MLKGDKFRGWLRNDQSLIFQRGERFEKSSQSLIEFRFKHLVTPFELRREDIIVFLSFIIRFSGGETSLSFFPSLRLCDIAENEIRKEKLFLLFIHFD